MSTAWRFLAFLSAAALVLLAMPSSVGAADSPELISGVLRSAGGQATSGRIIVFYDDLRENNRLLLASTSQAGSDGRYRIGIEPSPAMVAASARNGGYANFVAYAVTGDGISQYRWFSARYEAGTWRAARDELDKFDVSAILPLPASDYDERVEGALSKRSRVGIRMLTPMTTGDQWLYECRYSLIATYDRETPVAELHTSYLYLTGKAVYGKTYQADSDITTGVRASIEVVQFIGSGTHHVGTSSAVETSLTKTGSYGKVLSSSFRYKRWRWDWDNPPICGSPPAPYEILQSTRWNGTAFAVAWDDSGSDGKCQSTYNQYKQKLLPGADWSRYNNSFTGYRKTISLSAGLSAETTSWSGASTRVGREYHNGSSVTSYYICGNTDFPAWSLRIFSGG